VGGRSGYVDIVLFLPLRTGIGFTPERASTSHHAARCWVTSCVVKGACPK
jgi:hypothetical protein